VARTRYTKTVEDFKAKIQSLRNITSIASVDRAEMNRIDWSVFEQWFAWKQQHSENIRTRLEGNIVTIYTNDLTILNVLNTLGDLIVYEPGMLMSPPKGIKYFAREPKFKYRVYLTDAKVHETFYTELDEFYKRFMNSNTKIQLGRSVRRYIRMEKMYGYLSHYANRRHYIEYNDETMLTLLHLQFSGAVGDAYKLEKQPQQ